MNHLDQINVLLQPAYILQHRKYRESSLIIDVLTRDFGIVSVLARGVRKKKSKIAGSLLAFSSLKLSYTGKNELKLLTHVELDGSPIKLIGIPLYCSFYVNELIRYFLYKHDPYPEVFVAYQQCLTNLSNTTKVEETLRYFELNLLEYIGYGIQLTLDIDTAESISPLKKYSFNGDKGIKQNINGYVCGETLQTLESRGVLDGKALPEAKLLMRHAIDFQLQGKVLKSRAVLAKIIKQL